MRRVLNDAPGPGQEVTLAIIDLANSLVRQGNTITIGLTPAHRGIERNEHADQRAAEACFFPPPWGSTRRYSLAFLRRRTTERAAQQWRQDIETKNAGRRTFRLPTAASRPAIRPRLCRAHRDLATRLFQRLSSHALTAPFLKERWGWTETDKCWWCGRGRQSREHLFKECPTWKKEIRELWNKVGDASEVEGRPTRTS